MSLRINTNVEAFNAHRQLVGTQTMMSQSMEKLSSGLRINRAADDAAGLAISEKMRAQINGIDRAHQNAMDGISMVQTGEGALNEVHSILQRVRDLAVQAGSDSNNADSRKAITTEVTQLVDELARISDSTNFNGIKLLDASAGAAGDGVLSFQVGADGAASSQITVNLASADIKTLATDLKADIVTTDGFATPTLAAATITTVDAAIKSVSSARADLGAVQNRFESTVNSLQVSAENLSAAKSRIADTDMAAEMVKYTAANILAQAGTAMLAQANQSGQGVLQLLR